MKKPGPIDTKRVVDFAARNPNVVVFVVDPLRGEDPQSIAAALGVPVVDEDYAEVLSKMRDALLQGQLPPRIVLTSLGLFFQNFEQAFHGHHVFVRWV